MLSFQSEPVLALALWQFDCTCVVVFDVAMNSRHRARELALCHIIHSNGLIIFIRTYSKTHNHFRTQTLQLAQSNPRSVAIASCGQPTPNLPTSAPIVAIHHAL